MEKNFRKRMMRLRIRFFKWLVKFFTSNEYLVLHKDHIQTIINQHNNLYENLQKHVENIIIENKGYQSTFKNLQGFRSNSEFHIKELIQTISRENSKQETIAMSVNHILGQMQDIMSGKGYNPEQRWVVFNPAMSMQNERTLHNKQ